MGKLSRSKGARGEREVAKLLETEWPRVRRRCSGEESQSDQGRDLDGTPGFCFQVQMAAAKGLRIMKKFREAVAAANDGEIPAALTRVCSRSESGEWLVTLRVTDFLTLL